MEDGLTPCPRAAAQMAAFDRLPPEYRWFLAEYPRAFKAEVAERLLILCGGDVQEAIDEIQAALPVRQGNTHGRL